MTESIPKIVLTGGPCSGKSSCLSYLSSKLPERSFYPLFVPEAATSLISGMNIRVGDTLTSADFQDLVLEKQLQNEFIAEKVARKITNATDLKPVIICDRAIMDGLASSREEEFLSILKSHGVKSRVNGLSRYLAVLHLATAPREYYTTKNNAARSEGYERALKLGAKVLDAWKGASKLWTVENPTKGGFDAKKRTVLNYVLESLGEPPVERERKFVLENLNLAELQALSPVEFHIEQYYLKSEDGTERRTRKKTYKLDAHYYYTEKTNTEESGARVEIERRISESEFNRLLLQADPHREAIIKRRFCFVYNAIHWELDIFENTRSGLVLLEYELPKDKMEAGLQFPNFLKVSHEDLDGEYSNSQLSNPQLPESELVKCKIF